ERELIVRVILPSAMPSVMTGVRLSMGIAWVLVVVAEILAVRSGLGYLLNDAYQFYRNDVVIASMLSIGILGFLTDRLVVLARDWLLAWNTIETFRGQNGTEGRDKDVLRPVGRGASARRRLARYRRRRVHYHRWRERLRQIDGFEPARRLRAAKFGTGADRWPAGDRPRPRPRRGVSTDR